MLNKTGESLTLLDIKNHIHDLVEEGMTSKQDILDRVQTDLVEYYTKNKREYKQYPQNALPVSVAVELLMMSVKGFVEAEVNGVKS